MKVFDVWVFCGILLFTGCTTSPLVRDNCAFSVTYSLSSKGIRLSIVNHSGHPVLVEKTPSCVQLVYSVTDDGVATDDAQSVLQPQGSPTYCYLRNVPRGVHVFSAEDEYLIKDINFDRAEIKEDLETRIPKLVRVTLTYCPVKSLGARDVWYKNFNRVVVDAIPSLEEQPPLPSPPTNPPADGKR